MATENNNNTPKENQGPQSEGRRNALKALATIPVLGALGYGVYKKQTYDKKSKRRTITCPSSPANPSCP